MIKWFRKRPDAQSMGRDPVLGARVVLVVDDSATEVHFLKKLLIREGYRVEVASNGREGLEKAKALQPDLIIMDIVMPEMDGFQATRKLHNDEMTQDIPIIVVTSKDQEIDRAWGLRQGARAFLVKPVVAKEFLATVRSMLRD